LGCEARISEVRPAAFLPRGLEQAFAGAVDDEPLVIALDQESVRTISEEVVPGAQAKSSGVVLEYLVRRFLASLALSWSGPESSKVRFDRPVEPGIISVSGAVKVSFVINTANCSVWIGLGERLVEKLDGLWRRQVQSSARVPQGVSNVHLELAQLGVPPQMLADYLKKGTVIDLEVKASDSVTLRVGNRPWMPARVLDIEGKFGCEMAPGALATPTVPEGTTRLSVELGMIKLDAAAMAELGQAGAVLSTDLPISERVVLVINEDKVGEARLCVYEGRFAIEVQ
jgi:flagellar motor switch/type III secretory pathway protein FliN